MSDIKTISPVKSTARIKSLDVIRGIALLGILLMNIHGMGLPFAYSDPSISGGSEGWNLNVWILNELFFEGTMRGLFTMLFGAGMILLISRLEKNGIGIKAADVYYKRLLWLLIFGIAHAYLLLWHGDILYPYAIIGLLLFPLRNMSAVRLFSFGVFIIMLASIWDISDHFNHLKIQKEGIAAELIKQKKDSLTKDQTVAFEAWEGFKEKPSNEKIEELINEIHQGYWSNVISHVKLTNEMQSWVMYRYFALDIFSFMLIGMAFFKWKVFQGECSIKTYFLMLLIGYSIGLVVNYFETFGRIENNFDPMVASKFGMTYQLGRIFMTIGHVGFFMLFIKSGVLKFLQNSLSAVGRMALTNYLMHSIITGFIFFGFGFALYGKLQRYELYYVIAGIWIFQLIISPIWLKYFRFGPFEWLWRSLTYGRKQPFRNNKS